MYESTFTLERRPFSAAPQIEFYFPVQSIETARQTITACIRRGNGPSIVIGEPGTGKTLLFNVLAQQFQSTDAVALLTCVGVRTRRALLQLIQFELGYNYRKMDEGDLRLSLMNQATNPQFQNGLVLLVDESHLLTPKLFEELRMLNNIVLEGRNRVHIVLAGNTTLEERLTSPRLEAFNQRIAARCYVSRFNLAETAAYIQSQVSRAGGDASEVLTADAFEAVYQATGGVARLINQVCDHALILAAAGGRQLIDAEGVQEAWADLQQLPMPSPAGRMASTSDVVDVVEFGALDNEVEEEIDEGNPLSECVDGDRSLSSNPEKRLDIIEDHVAICDDEFFDEMSFESEALECPDANRPDHEDEIGPTLAEDPFRMEFEDEEIVVEQFGDSHLRISLPDDEPCPNAHDDEHEELPDCDEREAEAKTESASVDDSTSDTTVVHSQLESVADENRLADGVEATHTEAAEYAVPDPVVFFGSRADTEVDLDREPGSDVAFSDKDPDGLIAEPIWPLQGNNTTENDRSDDEIPRATHVEPASEYVAEEEHSATVCLSDLLEVKIDDGQRQVDVHPEPLGPPDATSQPVDVPNSNEQEGVRNDGEFSSDSPDATLHVSTRSGLAEPAGMPPPDNTSEMTPKIDDYRESVVFASDNSQLEYTEDDVESPESIGPSSECETESTDYDTIRTVKTKIYGQLFSRIRSRQGRSTRS